MSEGEKKAENRNDSETEKRFERMLEDAVLISDRFAREPVYGPTGKGYYKSAGVEGLRQDIERLRVQDKSDDEE